MSIYKQVAKIQQELIAKKGQTNNFGKYKYRSCEDIIEAVKPLLGDLSLIISDDIILIGDRYYVKAVATITDGESQVSTSALAREAESKKGMDASQITGTASSYARKYALNGLLAIDDTKDADSLDNRQAAQSQDLVAKANEKHAETIKVIKKGVTEGDLSVAQEAWSELTDAEKKSLWVAPSKGGAFTTEEREVMKSTEFRTANGAAK